MMRKLLPVVLTVCIAVAAFCAGGLAEEETTPTNLPAPGAAPIVTSPKPDTEVGPATLVVGRAALGSLIVIYTQVYDLEDENIKYRPVPGHRHRVNPDGSFALLISTPRIFFVLQRPLRYEINVYAISPDGKKSPHTVIPVKPIPPEEN